MLSYLAPKETSADKILAQDDSGRVLRYGDLLGLKLAWQARLPGRCLVILLCGNTVPHLAAYAGLHGAGHVLILLPCSISDSSLSNLSSTYQVEAVVRADANGEIQLERCRKPAGLLHKNLSICLSTSGSTGSPKLVRYSDEQLAANAIAIKEYLNIGTEEVAGAHLPFDYSFGLSVVHSHVAAGAQLELTEHSVIQKPFWDRMRIATSLAGVPFHFDMFLRLHIERMDLPSLRTLTQAGGPMVAAKVKQIHWLAQQRGWKFHIMYGQTEAGPRISWLPHDLVADWPDCIGSAIPSVTISLQEDELVVKSPSVMMGYAMNRIDLARGDCNCGILFTGDLAEVAAPGIFRITGRKSRYIKIHGNRVSLQDAEVRMHEAGHDVYAVGHDNLLLLYTTEHDSLLVRQVAIKLFSLPPVSIQVQTVSSIPRTANGKIDYAVLHALTLRNTDDRSD